MKRHRTLRFRYGASLCDDRSPRSSSKLHLGQRARHTKRIQEGLRFTYVHVCELHEQRTDRLCSLLCCFLPACEGKRGDSMNLQCLSLQPASANSLVAHQGDPIIFPNDLKPCFVSGTTGNVGTDPTNIGASRLHREGQYARVNGFIQIEDGLLKPLLVGQARNGSPPEWQRE